MNKKLILRHYPDKNPYGLYNSQLEPMNRKETLSFFEQIGLTDKELLLLNSYIREDKEHSFYDNAYMVWDECGEPMNFIDGLRMSDICLDETSLAEDDEALTITYDAQFEDQSWSGTVNIRHIYNDYADVIFKGRGSAIRAFVGRADELWIGIPYHHVCTTLAGFDDVFWNSEKLSTLLKSSIDGATLAYGIKSLCEEYLI